MTQPDTNTSETIVTNLEWKKYKFEITYEGTTPPLTVYVYNTNRGAAWAMICRDLSKKDHGDARTITKVTFLEEITKGYV